MKHLNLYFLAFLFLMASCQEEVLQEERVSALTLEKSANQLLLEDLVNNMADLAPSNARINKGTVLTHELLIRVSRFDIFQGAGRLVREISGTLELQPADKIPELNVIAPGQDIQLLAGTFTFLNRKGELRSRNAGAVLLEDGSAELLISNLPGSGDVFSSGFVPEGDFLIEGIITRNQRDQLRSVDVAGTFVAPELTEIPSTINEPATLPESFEHSIVLTIEAYDTQSGTIGDVVQQLSGTASLEPVDEITDIELDISGQNIQLYDGTFSYTNLAGEQKVIRAVAFTTESVGNSAFILPAIEGVSNEVSTSFYIPDGNFFVENLARRDLNNSLIAVSIDADFIEPGL